VGKEHRLAHRMLVAWLSFGIFLGPNVCCCSLGAIVSMGTNRFDSECLSCCCKAKSPKEDAKSCPFGQHPNGPCPCKQGGKKDLVPATSSSTLDAAIHWFAKLQPITALVTSLDHFVVSDSLSKQSASDAKRKKGPCALALCPILRC
jgi:hypothetical protein